MSDFSTEIYIDCSAEKAWHNFISPNTFFWEFYKANIQSSFELGEDFSYVGPYEGKETTHIYGKVLAYEPGKKLAYTDHPGPDFYPNHADMESEVHIEFSEVDGNTKIALRNDNFSKDNPMKEKANLWYLILSNFKTYCESGKLMNTIS